MKKLMFNMSFVLTFFFILSMIIKGYYGIFEEALADGPELFPTDESLLLHWDQEWTDNVRDIYIKEGQQAEKVPVLMYHRVISEEDLDDTHFDDQNNLHSTIILKENFEAQMQVLKDHDYTTLTAKELKLFLEKKIDVPKNSIVITLDDGFKNSYVETYPILKKHRFTALNFIITGAVTKKDNQYDSNTLQYLSVSDIEQSTDVFEFQSHTFDFHQRTNDDESYLLAKSAEEVMDDIHSSIVNLNDRKRSFAYPYGEYNEGTIDLLEDFGFEMAFTVEPDMAMPGINLYEIPRIEIYPDDTLSDFKKKINLE